MAPRSGTLAWKIPGMEEPGGLQSTGSLRVGHDWATSLSTFMHWRRKWQPTPVFLPGESQGWGSLVGCRLWGCTESDTTEATSQQPQQGSNPSPLHWEHSLNQGNSRMPSQVSVLLLGSDRSFWINRLLYEANLHTHTHLRFSDITWC